MGGANDRWHGFRMHGWSEGLRFYSMAVRQKQQIVNTNSRLASWSFESVCSVKRDISIESKFVTMLFLPGCSMVVTSLA